MLHYLARLAFACGVIMCLMGMVVSFVPGSEQGWFTVAGLLVSAGILLPHWQVRAAAIVIAIFCAYAAFEGHRRGDKYRERQSQRSR